MDPRAFLDELLPDEGWYCAFGIDEAENEAIKQRNKGKSKEEREPTKKAIVKFHDNKDALFATLMNFDANKLGTFVATSSFKTDNSRKAENALYTKAILVDLDVKEGRYNNKDAILSELKSFCIDNELPKPLLNESGGGYHAYWIFDEPVESARAADVGVRFKKFCALNDFDIDTNVTGDVARVMRMPGTNNYKLGKDNPRPCTNANKNPAKKVPFGTFEDLTKDVKSVSGKSVGAFGDMFEQVKALKDKVKAQPSAAIDRVLDGRDTLFKQIIKKTKAGNGCAQIKHIVKSRETLEEPYWRAGLSIAVRCTDKELAVKAVASGHPDYDYEESVKKGEATTGPYTCEAFSNLDPSLCKGCPHAGKLTSPIQLGHVVVEATEEQREFTYEPDNKVVGEIKVKIPELPKGYLLGRNQAIYKIVDMGDGDVEEILIYENPLWVDQRFKDPVDGELVVVKLLLPKDGLQVFSVKLETMTSKEELRKELSRQGVVVSKWEKIMEYMASWVKELQVRERAHNARRQFGWNEDRTCFALGELEYTPDGVKPNYPTSATSAHYKSFATEGSIDNWKKIPEFYLEDDVYGKDVRYLRYAICASFGSVLMEFLDGVHSSIFHMNSNGSGKAKTAIMRVMASIWGNPSKLVINGTSTENFLFNRAEVMKNIVLPIDEITQIKKERLSSFVMMSTQGQQKGRMSASTNVERFRGDPWNLLTVSTANNAITEKLAGENAPHEAIAARVLEVPMVNINFESEKVDGFRSGEFETLMADNYGVAGSTFIQHLVEMGPDKIRELLKKIQEHVFVKFRLEQKHRNWGAQISCTLLACQICKTLGILPYEFKDIIAISKDIVDMNKFNMVQTVREAKDVVTEYVLEHKGNMIVVNSNADLRKGGAENTALEGWTAAASSDPHHKVIGRLEPDTNKLYLLTSHLRNYCNDKGIVYRELQQELTDLYGAKVEVRRIDRGTNLKVGAVRVLTINQAPWLNVGEEA